MSNALQTPTVNEIPHSTDTEMNTTESVSEEGITVAPNQKKRTHVYEARVKTLQEELPE